MTRNQLFTALNKLCDEMNYSYDINCGGCCYVAAVLAENLENVNIPFKVVCCFSPTHYWIKVADRNINRDGFRKEDILNLDSTGLYFKYNSECWNEIYNRRWNLIISTRIRALFRKYENSRT